MATTPAVPTLTSVSKSCLDCKFKHLDQPKSLNHWCTWFKDTKSTDYDNWIANRPPWIDDGPKIVVPHRNIISIKQPYVDCKAYVVKPAATP